MAAGLGRLLSRVRDPATRRAVSRFNWAVLDQAFSSGSNFLIAIIVVRRASPEQFGAFSIVVLIYVLAVGAGRALNTEPLIVRFGGTPSAVRAAGRRALGFAALLGVGLGAACCGVALLVAGPLRPILLVLGVTFPMLLVQDAGRVICFALKQPQKATLNDGAWLLLMAILIGAALASNETSLWVLVTAWLGPGALAGLLVIWQLKLHPLLRGARAWLSENRQLNVPLFHAYVLSAAPSYLLYAIAPAVSSLAALGLARAGYIPFAAFGVFLQSGWLLLLPTVADKDARETSRIAVNTSIAFGSLALVWAAIVVVALPDSLGRQITGAQWVKTETLRTLFGCALVLQASAIGPLLGLTARAPKRLVRVRSVTSPLILGVGLVLTSVMGADGLAIGILVGDGCFFVLSWFELRKVASGRYPTATTGPQQLQASVEVLPGAERFS